MKKIITVILLSLVLLAGCTSKGEVENQGETTIGSVEASAQGSNETEVKKDEKVENKEVEKQSSKDNKEKANENNETKKTPNNEKNQNSKFTICIDPGHQEKAILEKEPIAPGSSEKKIGVTGGATGIVTKVPEYKLVLDVSKMLKNELEKKGYNVVMTRESNNAHLTNIQRAEIGNNCKADLVIRMHADSAESSSASGFSVLYPGGEHTKSIAEKSKNAASFIEKGIKNSTSSKSRGIISRSDMTGFNWSRVPTIIVEMGFLSNPNEDKMLSEKSYQEKIVNGITSGVEEYLK